MYNLTFFQVENAEGEISHEVLGVTSQTEMDRKKGGMTLPLGQNKFPPTDIQTPQDGPDEQSGMSMCLFRYFMYQWLLLF